MRIFLVKMKLFLTYFIKFEKDNRILPKKNLSNYIVENLVWKPIIIIIYNKNTFSANNN